MKGGQASGMMMENGKKDQRFQPFIKNVAHSHGKLKQDKEHGLTHTHHHSASMSLESTTAGFLCAHQDTIHVRSRGALCWSNFYFSCCHFPTLAPYPNARTCACLCPVRQPSTAWMPHHSSYCNQIESVHTKPKQALPKKKRVEKDLLPASEIISKAMSS